jgi:hypothetical protein
MARPVVVIAPAIEDDEYRFWNRAVGQHCLLDDDDDAETLYLTVTPTILAAAYSRARPEHVLPEEAVAAFVRCVSAVYRGRVLGHSEKLRVLRRFGPDGLPDCIAFLAASVLAAYEMRSDEETAGTAYYKRLADLLDCEVTGGHPRGFDSDEFEALWRFLEAWLRTEKSRRLALPGAEVGLRRYVALPLTHVPLRRVDIERLPEFFWWAGYEPRARINRSALDQDLTAWCLVAGRLTTNGAPLCWPKSLTNSNRGMESRGTRADAAVRMSRSCWTSQSDNLSCCISRVGPLPSPGSSMTGSAASRRPKRAGTNRFLFAAMMGAAFSGDSNGKWRLKDSGLPFFGRPRRR